MGKGTSSLAAQESKSYEKGARRFRLVLQAGGAPSWGASRKTENPGKFLDGLLGSARATTIGARVRSWEQLVRWLKLRKGVDWPTEEHHVIDYLWDQMMERPSPSFPRSLLAALSWIESRSGIGEDDKLHKRDGIKKCVEKAKADAEDGIAEKTRAPRLPVVVIAGLECAVFDADLPLCLRIVAWARLLKVFGALRTDDLQRIRSEDVHLQESGLTARLRRTKTSGAGKKVKDLTLFVPSSAWVGTRGWLEEGHGLWVRAAPWPRDHFLPRPAANLESFLHKVAEPADLAALSTRILEELKVPEVDVARESPGEMAGIARPTDLIMEKWPT